MQIPHHFTKDLEGINQQISELVGSLSRGRLSDSATMTCLNELLFQAQQLTEATEKAKATMQQGNQGNQEQQ